MALTAPSSTLTGQTVASSYDQLLFLDNASGVAEATLKIVSGTTGKTALQLSDENVLIKGVDTNNAAGFEVQQTDGTSILKIAAGTPSATLLGPLTVSVSGTGADVTIHSNTASEGLLYDASEDELGLLLTTKLKFHDIGGGEEIYASADGHLEIKSGTTIDCTSPTIDLNASTEVTIDTPSLTVTDDTTSSATEGGSLRLASKDGALMAADDRLGVLEFAGLEDGSTVVVGAKIQARAEEAFTATGTYDHATMLEFFTQSGTSAEDTLQTPAMVIDSEGRVSSGIQTPTNSFQISPESYSTGTAYQSGTTITGDSTVWTAAMIGSQFQWASGTNAGTITARASNTSITVDVSQTVASSGSKQSYRIFHTGLQITSAGLVGVGETAPEAPLHIKGSSFPVSVFERTVGSGTTGASSSLRLKTTTTGNMADTFGAEILFSIEDGTATDQPVGAINAVRAGADNTGNLQFISYSAGSQVKNLVLDLNSRISLSNNDLGANNTLFGYGAGASLDSNSARNTFIGYNVSSGTMNTALQNVGVGRSALEGLTAGDDNIGIGYKALMAMKAGGENIGIGSGSMDAMAGDADTDTVNNGYRNIAIGADAMGAVNAGSHNTATTNDNIAIGNDALLGASFSAADLDLVGNIAIGSQALDATSNNAQTGTIAIGHKALTALGDGVWNLAIGYQAMLATTSGTYNTAVGHNAMLEHDSGLRNTVLGYGAMQDTGAANALNSDDNVFIGYTAGGGTWAAKDCSNVVAIGSYAMAGALDGDGADGTVAIGRSALTALTTGAGNIAIGFEAGENLTTSAHNLAIGYQALENATTAANQNIAIGNFSMDGAWSTADVDNCVAIGYQAMRGVLTNTASSTVAIGALALNALTSGDGNTAVGYQALMTETAGSYSTAIGHSALKIQNNANGMNTAVGYNSQISTSAGQLNTSVGNLSMQLIGGSSANNNVAIGNLSMQSSGTITDNVAANNTAVGADSLKAITTGQTNVAIGSSAGVSLTTASKCILIGRSAGDAITVTGGSNVSDGTVAVGYNTLGALTGGAGNTAVGFESLMTEDTGDGNTAFGYKALKLCDGANDNGNTAVGYHALPDLSTGVGNVAIGYSSGLALTTGDRNTIMGFNALDAATTLADDNVAIGYNAMTGAIAAEAVLDCVAIGSGGLAGALEEEASGTVAIGKSALAALTSGDGNVAVGFEALSSGTDASHMVAIGYQAFKDAVPSGGGKDGDGVAIGYLAGSDATAVDGATYVGGASGRFHLGGYNTAVGSRTLYNTGEGSSSKNSTGNTVLGYFAMGGTWTDVSVNDCVAIGRNALDDALAAAEISGTIAIGKNALGALIGTSCTGHGNIAIGYGVLQQHTTGERNLAIGYGAMDGTGADDADTSNDNIFIGYDAGGGVWDDLADGTDDSNFNVGVGNYCMDAAMDGAVSNTAVGHLSASAITTGSENTCLGKSAGVSITTGVGNIAIGFTADVAAAVTNQIAIGYSTVVTAQYGIAIGDNISSAGDVATIGRASNVVSTNFQSGDGSWAQSSDERKKRNIKDDSLGLSFINDLKTKTFQWKPADEHPEEWKAWNEDEDGNRVYHKMDTDTVMHGLVAQEVKEALDKVGCDTFGGWKVDDNGQQELSKASFVIPLIKAVQELSAEVESLKEQLKNK